MLLDEVLDSLAPRAGQTAADCTVGRGGHALALASRLGPAGTLILNDTDAENLAFSASRVAREIPGEDRPRLVTIHGNFADLPREMRERGLRADVVLADLGFASTHIEEASRGFSFSRPGPLDMRMDRSRGPTAADLVNSMPEAELARMIREFGEDRHAARIARKLVEARRAEPISTTDQLARIVRAGAGPAGTIDPATRTFQALRIAVNDELGSLDALLASLGDGHGDGWLTPGARVGIISFHSLEDRRVKVAFRDAATRGGGVAIGPIVAGEPEQRDNPRARSAKLRVLRLPPSPSTA